MQGLFCAKFRFPRSPDSPHCHICGYCINVGFGIRSRKRGYLMSRISIDVTDDEHKKLKALAAIRGKSIKDYVIERTLGAEDSDDGALRKLEKILDSRIRATRDGSVSRRT